MKLLISLIILLAMLTPLVACGNQSDSIRASPSSDGELFTANPSSSTNDIETRLSILEQRLKALELKVLGGMHDNPLFPRSLEARLKAIEDKLGIKHSSW